jgi:hypothetical protein
VCITSDEGLLGRLVVRHTQVDRGTVARHARPEAAEDCPGGVELVEGVWLGTAPDEGYGAIEAMELKV